MHMNEPERDFTGDVSEVTDAWIDGIDSFGFGLSSSTRTNFKGEVTEGETFSGELTEILRSLILEYFLVMSSSRACFLSCFD